MTRERGALGLIERSYDQDQGHSKDILYVGTIVKEYYYSNKEYLTAAESTTCVLPLFVVFLPILTATNRSRIGHNPMVMGIKSS